MSWVDKKIQQYREGKNPTFLEKMALEHGHPVNFLMSILAIVALVYGLWFRDWAWIIVSLLLGIVGHLYCRLKK